MCSRRSLRRSEKKFVVDKHIFFMYYSLCREYDTQCASGSAVEHHLAKVGVAGSIPVSRSEGGVRIALQGWFGSFLMLKEIKNDFDDRRLQCLRFFVHLPQIGITEILRKR